MPATEEALVEMALEMTASQLEETVSAFKASEREALGKAAQRRARRYLRYRYDRDGNMVIPVCVPPEDGAMVIDVLEDLVRMDRLDQVVDAEAVGAVNDVASAADVSAEAPDAEERPEPDNRIEPTPGEQARADALIAMAERAATTLGDDVIATADRAHLLVTIDAGTRSGVAETACRLGCEGTMAVLIKDEDGNPLHLGDTTPTVSRRQKRALLARHTRFPQQRRASGPQSRQRLALAPAAP